MLTRRALFRGTAALPVAAVGAVAATKADAHDVFERRWTTSRKWDAATVKRAIDGIAGMVAKDPRWQHNRFLEYRAETFAEIHAHVAKRVMRGMDHRLGRS